MTAIGQGDIHASQLGRRLHRGNHPDGLLGPARLGPPARSLLFDLAQLTRYFRCRGAKSQQPVRVDLHLNFAGDPANPAHRTHAANREHVPGDVVVDEPGQGLVIHGGRGNGIGYDRHPGQIHLGDDRVAHIRGQIRTDTGHGVADVIDRLGRPFFQAEFGHDAGVAILYLGVDMFDTLERRYRVFNFPCDFHLHLRGRGAGQLGHDRDHGEIDIRIVLNLHGPEARQTHQGQEDEQQDGRNRILDRPGADVHGLLPGWPSAASATRTVSPSARNAAPVATTCTCGSRVLMISTASPSRLPSSTLVCVTLLAAPTV